MKRLSVLIAAICLTAAALAALYVAAPAGAAPPRDAPQQNRSAPRSACGVQRIDTRVSPDPARVCEPAAVDVTMAITCPPMLPVHMVIAIDRSKSIADPTVSQILRDIQQSARAVIDALDFEAHPDNKVGVVSHGFRVTVETELTHQKSRVIGAVNGVKYLASDIGEDPGKAVEQAQKMLEDERGATSPIEIILLYGDGCDPSVAGCPAAAKRAAAQADGRGMAVMAMCYTQSDRETCSTSYRQMVSRPNYYFEASGQIPGRVKDVADQGKALAVTSLSILDKLAPGFTYVAGSGRPAPRVAGQDLTFAYGVPAGSAALTVGQVITAQYRAQPGAEGKAPLRLPASAVNLTDNLNRAADAIPLPTRDVDVGPCVVETPTPSATATREASPTAQDTPTPSRTPTPADTSTPTRTPTPLWTPTPTRTPTAAATSTPETVIAYLPIVMRAVCKPAEVHTDVALVIDASSSMSEQSGGGAKIDAAKAAAIAFVDVLRLGQDQAAVISFNSRERFETGLTGDRAALQRAINGIQTGAGTRIDLALAAAGGVLRGEGHREGNNRAVVLLTDGLPDAGTAGAALAAAADLKGGGVFVYTIGLGEDVDADLLRQIATSPSSYLRAPTADQLTAIYRGIAGALPCPAGVFWYDTP